MKIGILTALFGNWAAEARMTMDSVEEKWISMTRTEEKA